MSLKIMGHPPAVLCKKLVKRYGGTFQPAALVNLDLEIQTGEVVVLLGPNGSGKTTLLQVLAGLIHPSSGLLEVNGQRNPEKWEGRIAWLSEKENYPLELSAREYLVHLGELSGFSHRESQELVLEEMDKIGLGAVKNARMRTFSAGMLKKVALAALEIGRPELYLLDEPAESLEPRSRSQLLQVLRKKADEGKTVILSTHHPEFLPEGIVRLVLLHSGEILFNGPLEMFQGEIEGYRLKLPSQPGIPADLFSECNLELEIASSEILLNIPDVDARKMVLEQLLAAGIVPEQMEPVRRGVEKKYREIMEKAEQEGGPSSR